MKTIKNKNPKKADLDANMVSLVKALNAFDGIQTIGSCGGHANPGLGQWEEGSFYLKFDLTWDDDGRFALEFVAWLINNHLHLASQRDFPGHVVLMPTAPPPYLNGPGDYLSFVIEGTQGADPQELARLITRAKRKAFISPKDRRAVEAADEGLASVWARKTVLLPQAARRLGNG